MDRKRSVLARFQLTNYVAEWTADPNEEWTRVRLIEVLRTGEAHVIFDETITVNPFGGDAFHLFQRCTWEAQGRMSRSALIEFAGRELKAMIYDEPADTSA